jgi:hypothetical protein
MTAKILLLVGLLLLVTVSEAHPTGDRDNLRGLRGFSLLVRIDEPNLEKDGVTHDQLQTRVEVKLRQAGIRILSISELPGTPGQPILSLRVVALRGESPRGYAFGVELGMLERVILDRDRNRVIYGMIWREARAGFVGFLAVRSIYEYVSDVLDVFITDYLAANPK